MRIKLLYIILVCQFLLAGVHSFAQTTVTLTSSGTWTVPAGITTVNLYLWGGGGAGGGATSTTANWRNGGGGGGGACAVSTAITVVPGQVWTVTIGAGGTGTSAAGGNGGTTTFVNGGTTYSASGGIGGSAASGSQTGTSNGGAGGSTGTGVVFSGGTGSQANNSTGLTGTGGGAGGSAANGTTPTNGCGVTGNGGTGTYTGGNGGYNTDCSTTTDDAGIAGAVPGGGGSGDNDWLTGNNGGNGGAGEIIITYSACAAPTTQSSAFTGTAITGSTMTAGWTRGNGNNVLVLCAAGSAPNTDPTSGTSYTANAAYGSGTALGNAFVIYNGAGTSVNLTGLSAVTTYYFAVYEYNTTGTCYNVAQLTGNATTTSCTCTLPFTENFDGAWSTAPTLANQSCFWTSSYAGAGNNLNDQWQREDYTTNWGSGTSGIYNPVYTSPSYSARFHNYLAPNGTTGSLMSPTINFSPAGTKTMTFEYINQDVSTLDVYLSTDGGVTYGASLLHLTTANSWTAETVTLGATVSTTCVIKFVATSNFGNFDMGIDDVVINAPGATSTLSSANPAVPTGNIAQSSTQDDIYSFSTTISSANMTINSVTFTTAGGTYVTADINKFQLWYSTTNTLASASQIGANITTTLGNGAHTFGGLSQVINSGTTGYFFITTDVTAGATVGHTIIVSAITNANLTFASGTSTGTAYVGGTQTIIAPPCTATLPFTQNFDAAWTTAGTLLNGACAWSSSYGGTNNNANDQWQRDDDQTSWTSNGGVYSPAYTSASHSARFHNYDAPNATYGDLMTPQINMSAAGVKTLTFQYNNADNSTLDIYVSTDGGNTYGSSLATFSTTTGWTSETVSLGAVVSATTKVKFRATGNNGNFDMGIDDVDIEAPPAGAPTTQATNLTFSGIDCQSMTVSCTKGNGTGRFIAMNTTNTFAAPVNGTPPAASNTIWANAGEQIIGSGTASTATVTGLTAGTTYWFKVYEYNGSGASILYDVAAGANNPLSQATAAIVAAPTTSASAITFSATTCTQTGVSWTNGNGANRIVVAKAGSAVAGTPVNASGYVANSSFGSGSSIAAGEYVVYSGSGTSVTVTTLSASTTYFFKVFEDNGTTGCESYKTTVPPSNSVAIPSCVNQIPYMTSAVINACPGSCGSEGANELLFFSSGSYAIPVAAVNMSLAYGSTSPATKVYNNSITANTAETAKLNAAVGCSGFFVDAVTAGTIPANTNFVMTSNNYCDGAYDFSTLCASGYGPLYVIYVDAAAWVQVVGSPSGNYANSASGSSLIRYFRSDFSTVTGGGTTGITDYSYYPNSLVCDCDGASVTWGPAGGAPTNYVSPNTCTFPMIVLPIELTDFTGTRSTGKTVNLNWTTETETNNAYFTLERSTNGTDFQYVAQVRGAGNSSITLHYAYVDDGAPSGMCYYRLRQTDFNGNFTRSHEIAVNPVHYFTVQNVYPNPANQQLNVSIQQESANDLVVRIYDAVGKQVYTAAKHVIEKNTNLQIDLSDFPAGMYLITVKGFDTDYQTKFIKQ